MLATAHAAAGRVRASDEDARVGVKTILLYYNGCGFILLLTSLMAQAGPIRTFADLRGRAITTWVQPISICFPTATGGHNEVLLCVDDDTQSLPMPLFEYELLEHANLKLWESCVQNFKKS